QSATMFWLDTAEKLSAARLATPIIPRFSLSVAEIFRLEVRQPTRNMPRVPRALCFKNSRRRMDQVVKTDATSVNEIACGCLGLLWHDAALASRINFQRCH